MLELKANMSVTILKFLEDRDTVKKKKRHLKKYTYINAYIDPFI